MYLKDQLMAVKRIKLLAMKHNKISDDGVQNLCEILQDKKISILDLSNNKLTF